MDFLKGLGRYAVLFSMKIFVKAKPGAKAAYVKKIGGDGLFEGHTNIRIGTNIRMGENYFVVAVKEPAIEGKANCAIEKALAEYFKIPGSRVKIVSGQKSREKIAEIS